MRLFLLGLVALSSAAEAQQGITGDWLVQDRTAIVRIAPCGASLCGSIVRLLVQKPNMPKTDVNNPDPALRNRPFVGLRILSGFSGSGDRWSNGRIYDPNSGKTYRSKLRLNADGSLGVSGCIAVFCRTQRRSRPR